MLRTPNLNSTNHYLTCAQYRSMRTGPPLILATNNLKQFLIRNASKLKPAICYYIIFGYIRYGRLLT